MINLKLETKNQIRFWIIEQRSRFTKLWQRDPGIENLLPEYHPGFIDLNTLSDLLSDRNQSNGVPLYKTYTNLFPILGIDLKCSIQNKLFVVFYRLSFHYCPTQQEWEEFKMKEANIEALYTEAIRRVAPLNIIDGEFNFL